MKKLLVAIGLAVLLAAIIGLSQYRKQQHTVTVTIATVSSGELADTILASGNLEFNTQIQIRSEITGRVIEVLVEEGQYVEQDQVLMRLDATAFEAEVARASAQVNSQQIDIRRSQAVLADLERQLNRQQQLFRQQLIQQETIDSLQSQLDIAHINVSASRAALAQSQAGLAMAEDHLRKTVYRAPIAGLLASVDIKPGETVIAGSTNIIGSPLMTLADPSAILAELRVDEADIANVHLDQQAEIFAAAYPNSPIKGRVIQIATSARQSLQGQGLAFPVKVLLEPQQFTLYPGMSCRAEIIMQQQHSLHIPVAAVQRDSERHFVWVVNGDIAEQRTVSLGMATDTAQQVLSGLDAGEQVITGPARTVSRLGNGHKVSAGDNQKQGS